MRNYQLSPEQIAQFDQDGFLIVRVTEHRLFDPKDLQEWIKTVKSWPKGSGKGLPYDEINLNGERQLMRTEQFVDDHPELQSLLCGEVMASILKQLSRNDMLLFKDKVNYKQPFGQGFGAHLDAPAYDHICKVEHLTANFAVDAATKENGCLEVVPGSNRMQVDLAHGGAISKEWCEKQEWLPVPLEPGDVLFFGSHLAHRSAENRTANSRAMVYATYSGKADGEDLRTKYYADRRVEFPPDHERLPGKDYSAGWKTYGFAAPFASEAPRTAKAV